MFGFGSGLGAFLGGRGNLGVARLASGKAKRMTVHDIHPIHSYDVPRWSGRSPDGVVQQPIMTNRDFITFNGYHYRKWA